MHIQCSLRLFWFGSPFFMLRFNARYLNSNRMKSTWKLGIVCCIFMVISMWNQWIKLPIQPTLAYSYVHNTNRQTSPNEWCHFNIRCVRVCVYTWLFYHRHQNRNVVRILIYVHMLFSYTWQIHSIIEYIDKRKMSEDVIWQNKWFWFHN